MNRFEKKCVIGSAAFHGLLVMVVLFGAAFIPAHKPEELPPVITIEAIATDRALASGGNPNANPVPTPPAPQPERIQPPPQPEPPPPKPEVKPEPKPKPQAKEKTKAELKKDLVEKDNKKEIAKPLVNTNLVKRSKDFDKAQREVAEREARERERKYQQDVARAREQQRKFAGEIGNIIGNVEKNMSKGAVVDTPGPGEVAYANYGSLVGEIYKRAVYATHPQSDGDAEAVIKVLVSRDGAVRNSQWTRRTGNSVLDKAVDRAMNSVRSLPAFPPEAKDLERSFNITIAFEAKRVSA